MSEKKWYNLFVSVDQPTGDAPAPAGETAAASAARQVAEIAASIAPAPKFSAPVSGAASFAEIYSAAEIQPPPHGTRS